MVHRSLGALALLVLGGCGAASAGARQADTSGSRRTCNVKRIESLQADDAWDVVRKCNLGLDLEESRDGSYARIRTRRGRSSILLRDSDVPVIVLDGTRLQDPRVLHQITATAVYSVELLSGIEGTMTQGTNAGAGVLVIETRTGPGS